jgi:hypothetical protein
MRRRWTLLIPPLLCGILADFCLVQLALRQRRDDALVLGVVVLSIGMIIGGEILRWQRQRGLVELSSIRYQGMERPGFLVPLSPYPAVGAFLICLLLIGVSLLVQISIDLGCLDSPDTGRMLGYVGLGFGVVGVGISVWSLLCGPRGLWVLPDGVLLPRQGTGSCFLPWELIEAISPVRSPLFGPRGPVYVAFRVTDVDQVAATPRVRRGMVRRHKRFRWHWLCAPGVMTLSAVEMAWLLRCYMAHPGERRKIGTQPELEEVRAALASVRSRVAW